jgi:ABC-type bacteriocin/lantibiotic exporter with double-glycine peptidase domain
MSIKIQRLIGLAVLLALLVGTSAFLLQQKTPVFLSGDDVILQQSKNDCGIACVKNVLKKSGRNPASVDSLLSAADGGVSMLDMKQALTRCGLSANGYKTVLSELGQLPFPMIARFNKNHFVVLEEITDKYIVLIDPSVGRMKYPKESFQEKWDGLILCVEQPQLQ